MSPRNVYFPGHPIATVAPDEIPVDLLGRSGIVSAVVTLDARNRVHLHPVNGEPGCSTPALAPSDAPYQGVVGKAVESVISYERRLEDGQSELVFIDERCKNVIEPLPNAKVLGSPIIFSPPSFVILTEDGRLTTLDVEARRLVTLTDSVTGAVFANGFLFTLEQNTLTIRDRKLDQLGRFGHNVREMRVDGANLRVAFVDDQGLSYLTVDAKNPVWVDKSACEVNWVNAAAEANALTYRPSCDDETRVVMLPNQKQRYSLPEGATGPLTLRNLGDGNGARWYLGYFREVDASTGLGTLFWGPLDGEGTPLGHARTDAPSIGPVDSGQLLIWLTADSQPSRIVTWSETAETTYLSNVVDADLSTQPGQVLVTEGQVSRLYLASVGSEPELRLDHAAGLGLETGYGKFLFSNDKDQVADVSFAASTDRALELLFEDALVPSVRLFWGAAAAGALTDYDVDKLEGTLCVRLIESADTFCQPRVRSYAPTLRPATGVAYVAGSKLYWAEAQ